MVERKELLSRLRRRIDEIHGLGNEIDEPFETTEEKNERLFDLNLYPYPPYSTLVIVSILEYLISQWETLDEIDRGDFLCSLPAVLDYEDKLTEQRDDLAHEIARVVLSCKKTDRILIADAFKWINSQLPLDDTSHPQFERMAKHWSGNEIS